MPEAIVDREECMGCGLCRDICPYEGAVTIKEWKSEIDMRRCEGCGACVGVCPSLALNIKYLSRKKISARVKALLKKTQVGQEFEPKIIIYMCDWLSRKGASISDISDIEHSSNVRATKFPCIAAIDPIVILNAFLDGADGILTVGCGQDDCNHIDANVNAEPRIKYVRMCLENLGVKPERLGFELISLSDAKSRFVAEAEDIIKTVKSLGPNPI